MAYYDLKEQRFINDRMSGVIGHISFRRLAAALVAGGEIQPWERVTGVEIVEDTIRYRVEPKES